jgi:hypothetical protein
MFVENYIHKFEVKPGRLVFVPGSACIARGQKIVDRVSQLWNPSPIFYHLGKRGGHVAAMRPHVDQAYKASVDISNFFGCVTRPKLKRALRKIGMSEHEAFEIAYDSCVNENGQRHLPYGFVQSMLLATLAMDQSRLGHFLEEARYQGFRVTVYVDDIIVSHNDLDILTQLYGQLLVEVAESGFAVALAKCSPPSVSVPAFNCEVSDILRVSAARMQKFSEQFLLATDQGRKSITRYVAAINSDQANQLVT